MNTTISFLMNMLSYYEIKSKVIGEYAFQLSYELEDCEPLHYDIVVDSNIKELYSIIYNKCPAIKILKVSNNYIIIQKNGIVINIYTESQVKYNLNIELEQVDIDEKSTKSNTEFIIKLIEETQEFIQCNPISILNTLRYAIKYNLSISDETSELIKANTELIDKISVKDKTAMLRDMLCCNKPVKHVFLTYSDIIAKIIPEIEPCINFNQNSKYHSHDVYEHMLYVVDYCNTTKFEIKLAALLHDIGKPNKYVEDEEGHGHFHGHPVESYNICKEALPLRLKLTSSELEHTLNLIFEHDYKLYANKAAVKRFASKYGYRFIDDWMILKQADLDDHINLRPRYIDMPRLHSIYYDIMEENNRFSLKKMNINGNDIMRITGEKPGKTVGTLLVMLMDRVLDERVENEYKALEAETIRLYNKEKEKHTEN